jgi:GlpG protein
LDRIAEISPDAARDLALRDPPLRQIGSLPGERDARRLADHLLTLGVSTQLRPETDGWGVWVLDENRLPLARQEFDDYRIRPDDPRFQSAAGKAEALRRESMKVESRYRKNVRYMSDTWGRTPFRRRPLTVLLVGLCVIVYMLQNLPETRGRVINELAFTSFIPRAEHLGQEGPDLLSMDDIARGEVWRLVTPIFLHFNLIHILFNMWFFTSLGTIIETHRGTRTLAALILFTAVTSNVGQHLYNMKAYGHPVLFGGMSGVGYALFGYAWMKGRFEPEEGIILHPSTVQSMLFWLILCMTGTLGNVANAAHVVGMIAGILCGLARL